MRLNSALLLIGFCMFSLLSFCQKQSTFRSKALFISNDSLKNKFHHFTAIKLESKKLSQFVRQSNTPAFQLNIADKMTWDIELEPSDIATSNYQLKLLTPQGIKTISSRPDFLFKGKVKGSKRDEQVRLSIKEGFIYGSIQTDRKEYFIEPLSRFIGTKEKDEYVVYEAKDVLTNTPFSCGVTDKESSLKQTQQNALREQSPQSGICKKIKFISVADYSIYQKFGSDVYAVETALLSNLNLAEAAFTTLNLGADGSSDAGTDNLQFEMEEMVVSTCKECDIARGEENASTIGNKLLSWASKNIDQREGKIAQYWTGNFLFDITGKGLSGTISNLSNCYGIAGEVLRYGTDDPAFLRVLVAHETGHTLGCRHDDEVKPSVRDFIMYSGANGSRTRFSTLADFGGMNYSSQQTIRNTVLTNISCLADCGNNDCAEVKDLKIDYGNFDTDIQLSWTGSGNYLVKYKINDSSFYDPAHITQTSFNIISLKELEPCALYKFEIQRNCGSEYSKANSIIFKTSSLSITSKPVNIHGDKYDLELNIDCKKCSGKEYFIRIDAKLYEIPNDANLKQVVIKDLFADGARHRIEMNKDSGNLVCTTTSFYTAPYYRSSSKKLLNGDFNGCDIMNGWKDSLLAKRNLSAPDAHWIVAQQNFFTVRTPRGSLDSSCMIYYNSFNTANNAYSGSLSLTSPKMDLTKYTDIKLHYDYNFLAYKFSNVPPVGSVAVEAFDGTGWQKIAEREADMPNGLRNIWDSLPSRVFIDLDNYNNKNFQLRFIVDDGSLIQKNTLGIFAAFDNIQIDGYLKDSTISNDITVYPNPAKEEIFIRFNQQSIAGINYRIVDINGKIVDKGLLNNYRVNVNRLSSGMYLLLLYDNDKTIAAKKILRQ